MILLPRLPFVSSILIVFAGFLGFGLPAHGELTASEKREVEAVARAAAVPYAEKEKIEFRSDVWVGELTGAKGKAVRVQCIKGRRYRFIVAAGAAEKKAGTKLHVAVVDGANRMLEKGGGKGSVATVRFRPKATGLYLILVRAETKGGGVREIPCAMVFGSR